MTSTIVSPKKIKAGHYVKNTFPVLEMTCAACAISVESMLKATNGVKDAGGICESIRVGEYDETSQNGGPSTGSSRDRI
jgi:Cu2+-exporting ATPase